MPRKAIGYSKPHFYKIVCNDLLVSHIYVGHTTDFTKRKHSHKQACINPNLKHHNLEVYKRIRENGGWDNWDMVLISTEGVANSLEARRREREITEQLQANLNMVRAFRSKEEADEVGREFRENHKEEKKEYDKVYRENNKEHRQEISKVYRKNNRDKLLAKTECACGNTYVYKNKSRHERSNKHQNYLNTLEPID